MHPLLMVALVVGAPAGVTFQAAREVAAARAPDVRIAERRVGVSAAEVAIAGTLENPTLTVSTARESARFGTALSIPVPVFGQTSAAIDAAEADRIAMSDDVEVVRVESRWAATVAWIDLWEAQARASQLALGAVDAEKIVTIAKERFDAGTGARLDVVRADAELARARAEAQADAAAVRSASARLSSWIGGDRPDELAAAGEPGFSAVLPPLADLERALGDHPTVRRDRAQEAAADAHVDAEKRARWPIINGELGVDAFDPGLPRTDIIVGLSLPLPVFSLRGGFIERAGAEHALAQAMLEADRHRLLAGLVAAYRTAEAAGIRATALDREVLPLIEQARSMTEEGYRDGRVDLLRVLEATRALLDIRIERTTATAALHRALADLERSVGHPWEATHAAP